MTEAVLASVQGLPAPVVGAMAENATLFLAYSVIQDAVGNAAGVLPGQALSLPQLGIAAAAAGAVTSFALCVLSYARAVLSPDSP